MKLDRTRPFGEICGGAPVSGAKFEQGGKYFNGAGDLLEWQPSGKEAVVTDEEPEEEPEVKEPSEEPEKEKTAFTYVTPVVRRKKATKK